jgi:hypothetical protein
MKIEKEKIIIYSILAPLMFATVTFFGFAAILITQGKLFICSFNIGFIDALINCDATYIAIEGNGWFISLLAFLGKLFVWVTVPVAAVGYVLYLAAGFFLSKQGKGN